MTETSARTGAGADGTAAADAPPVEDPADSPTARKDPDQWVTGDEPMTGPQASYLRTLAREADEPYDADLTKAEASRRIDDLRRDTGRERPT